MAVNHLPPPPRAAPENTMTAELLGALYTQGFTLNRSVTTSSSPSLTCVHRGSGSLCERYDGKVQLL